MHIIYIYLATSSKLAPHGGMKLCSHRPSTQQFMFIGAHCTLVCHTVALNLYHLHILISCINPSLVQN